MTPINLIFVSDDKTVFSEVEKELVAKDLFSINHISTFEGVIRHVKENDTDVAVVAEKLGDQRGFECVQQLVKLNPFINCALVSPLSHDQFHEATEGYGVFMQLSLKPGSNEAEELVEKISKIYSLAGEPL